MIPKAQVLAIILGCFEQNYALQVYFLPHIIVYPTFHFTDCIVTVQSGKNYVFWKSQIQCRN